MIVKTENLSREFVRGKNQFYAVDHVNLEVEEKNWLRSWDSREVENLPSSIC